MSVLFLQWLGGASLVGAALFLAVLYGRAKKEVGSAKKEASLYAKELDGLRDSQARIRQTLSRPDFSPSDLVKLMRDGRL